MSDNIKIEEENRERHGGPFDRGSADSYYGRVPTPHFFEGATYASVQIEEWDMTPEEIQEYLAGYQKNEEDSNFKEW